MRTPSVKQKMRLVMIALFGAHVMSMCGLINAYCPTFSSPASCAEHEIRWGNSWYLCEWNPQRKECAVGKYCGSLADRLTVDPTSATAYDWSTRVVPPAVTSATCNSSTLGVKHPCGEPNKFCPYIHDATTCGQVRARWDTNTWYKCKWDTANGSCDWGDICAFAAAQNAAAQNAAAQTEDFQWDLLTRRAPPRVDSLNAFLQTVDKATLEQYVSTMVQSSMCPPASACLETRFQANGSLCLLTMAWKTSKGEECACRGFSSWSGYSEIAFEVHFGNAIYYSWIQRGQTIALEQANSVCYVADARWV